MSQNYIRAGKTPQLDARPLPVGSDSKADHLDKAQKRC
jgi:hypothetical protein